MPRSTCKLIALQLLLLLHGPFPLVIGQNSSLRINTNLKEFDQTAAQGNGANICTREEPYMEVQPVPVMEPVRVRTSSWCLEIPPRCATFKTEMREVIKVEKLNKTRTVRFCCNGYEGNLSDSQATCKPICHGGCGRGTCISPDMCNCEEGYTGKHCTQRCDHDRWGLGCKNLCQCQNAAVCDNKTGLCHCIAGWAGQFCEQPCPPGTHGIMCRKGCECANKLCHPQTGHCISEHATNVTHVMFETLNSTIANITHNLDHIARKIGNIPAVNAESSSTAKPVPEVILIKQAEEVPHAPKIILHQSSNELLENLHSAATAGGNAPEVIHVITNWPANGTAHEYTNPQLNLAGLASGVASVGAEHEHAKNAADHDASLLTTLLIILIIVMISITLSFLYVYRRYHWHKQPPVLSNGVSSATNGNNINLAAAPEVVLTEATLGKSFLKPLPELPRHQTAMPVPALKPPHPHPHPHHTNDAPPELYDTPSNNSSIKTPPYAYARKESLYSVVSPKSRKGSLDSHLYDEIRYHQQHQHSHNSYSSQPSHHNHNHNHNQRRFQHATTAAAYLPPAITTVQANGGTSVQSATHHVAHLIIPPQNSKYLQVPTQMTSHKIAHL